MNNFLKLIVIGSLSVLSACNTNPDSNMSTNDKIMSMASQQDATHLQSAERNFSVGKMMDDLRGKSKFSRLKGDPDYFFRFQYQKQDVQLSSVQQKQLDDLIQLLSPTKKYRVLVEAGMAEGNKSIASYLSEERLVEVQKVLKPHFAQVDGFCRKSIPANEVVIQFTAGQIENKKG